MNKYQFFNNWVYLSYLDRAVPNKTGSFAIDLQRFLDENGFANFHFEEIKKSKWSLLLKGDYQENECKIPKYFGLIALQCYAALLMENDGFSSERVYQDRFCELVGLSSNGNLQLKFREDFEQCKVQEAIWTSARNHFLSLNVSISIPDLREGVRRYVQYPLSQVVLNKEDLKEFIPLFKNLEDIAEHVSFADFQRYFRIHKSRFLPTLKRPKNKKEDFTEVERKIRIKQIFDFYCTDWHLSFIAEKGIRNSIKLPNCIAQVSGDQVELFDYLHNPFDIESLPFKDYLLFKQSEYENEFDVYKNLEFGVEFLICCREGTPQSKKGDKLLFGHNGFHFYRVKFANGDDLGDLKLNIFEPFPLNITGIKINRKGHFLHGFGPVIESKGNTHNFTIHFGNHRILNFNHLDCQVGEYKIKVSGHRDFSFVIADFKDINDIIESQETGWGLSTLEPVASGSRVNGLLFSLEKCSLGSPSINTWIDKNIRGISPVHTSKLMERILRSEIYGNL